MAEPASPLANRDEPIPVIRIGEGGEDTSDAESDQATTRRQRDRLRERAIRSSSRLREKFEGDSEGGGGGGRQSLQDRLFNSVLSQILPSPPPQLDSPQHDLDAGYDEGDDGDADAPPRKKDRRSKYYVDKPEFGPRLM